MADAENKEDKDKLADTNMENYGGEEHRNLKKAAAETEKAWRGAGEEAGLQIWRIEQFKVKKVKKSTYGQFHTGDSYIILQTIENEEGKDYNVFFWLGAETTQDEAGTAAYKTVELDDLLGDEPVQYREVQGNETDLFLNLFKDMKVLPGGVKSGFRKVTEAKWDPILDQITGDKKHVQIFNVTKQGLAAMNKTDCFILDCREKIYVYHGAKASAWEKRYANQEVQKRKGAPGRGSHSDVHVAWDDDEKEFWDFFGGKPEELPEDEPQMKAERKMKMLKISDDDEEGKVQCSVVCEGKLDKTQLEDDDAFILDTGISIYIWIGKKAKASEKKECMKHVTQYMADNDLPTNIPVCRVIQGKEPAHFHSMMEDCADGKWDAKMVASGFCGRKSSKMAKRDKKKD